MPGVYEQFLEILHSYQEKKSTAGAIEVVKEQIYSLFRGHPDLLEDFKYFLPDGSNMKKSKRKKIGSGHNMNKFINRENKQKEILQK